MQGQIVEKRTPSSPVDLEVTVTLGPRVGKIAQSRRAIGASTDNLKSQFVSSCMKNSLDHLKRRLDFASLNTSDG